MHKPELVYYIELRHMGVRHFVIIQNGCTTKCGCIGLTLFCYLSCLVVAIICDITTIGFVSVYECRICDAFVDVVQPFTRRP